MHKVVILIEPVSDPHAFESAWPEFLHQVEAMPHLRREATSRVESFLFGRVEYAQMHELFFDSLEEAQQALASPAGRNAGRLLQTMTQGRMALFFAEHREDDLENIRKYRGGDADA
jgi:uncharacterized protein (TIGR02118 family)